MIEAGLGGRLDATNVIPSRVYGADLGRARAHRVARARRSRRSRPRSSRCCATTRRWSSASCRRASTRSPSGRRPSVTPSVVRARPSPRIELRARGALPAPQLRRRAGGAEAALGGLDADAVRSGRRGARAPGPARGRRRRPAAHPRRGPQPRRGARAGRGAAGGQRRSPRGRLPRGPRGQGRRGDRRRALAPAPASRGLHRAPARARSAGSGAPVPRAFPRRGWLPRCADVGLAAEAERDPRAAIARCSRARARARRRDALRRFALPSARGMDREARSELLTMMGLVAAVVAIVILVFFGLGYLFGRLFL